MNDMRRKKGFSVVFLVLVFILSFFALIFGALCLYFNHILEGALILFLSIISVMIASEIRASDKAALKQNRGVERVSANVETEKGSGRLSLYDNLISIKTGRKETLVNWNDIKSYSFEDTKISFAGDSVSLTLTFNSDVKFEGAKYMFEKHCNL